jgi:hypothetical protein
MFRCHCENCGRLLELDEIERLRFKVKDTNVIAISKILCHKCCEEAKKNQREKIVWDE